MRQAGAGIPISENPVRAVVFRVLSERREGCSGLALPQAIRVDGIILFYDITTLPFSMGLPFELKPERGPVPDRPILRRRTLND